MNGDHTVMVEILNAIEHGNLSVQETRRRLERLIDTEIERTDAPANMQLVEECEKLLWELNTNGQTPYISHMEENYAAVLKRAEQKQHVRSMHKNALRVCAVAAALFVLVIGAEILLRREWVNRYSMPDEQQHVIKGELVDPGLVQESVASEDEQSRTYLATTSMSEAIAFLSADFNIPEVLEGGWNLSRLECIKAKQKITLISYFTHASDPQKKLVIQAHRFNNIEDAYLSFEQNRVGSTVEHNGVELYLSDNFEKTRCMWMMDTFVCSISGQLENDEALRLADQIIGGT